MTAEKRKHFARLREIGYNFEEKASIYTGLAVGAIAPIVATRYIFFPLYGED